MKRIFIAIPVAEEVKEKIKSFVQELSASGADLKLVSLENLHLTLKFLGEVDEDKIPLIREKLSAISQKPFSISFQSIGVFPAVDRINVIWIGVDAPEWVSLLQKINAALNYIRKEEREEIPHLTLARMKSAKNKEMVQQLVEKNEHTSFGNMPLDVFYLYESELGPAGPVYTILHEFTLR